MRAATSPHDFKLLRCGRRLAFDVDGRRQGEQGHRLRPRFGSGNGNGHGGVLRPPTRPPRARAARRPPPAASAHAAEHAAARAERAAARDPVKAP